MGSSHPRKLGWTQPNPLGPQTKHTVSVSAGTFSMSPMDLWISFIVWSSKIQDITKLTLVASAKQCSNRMTHSWVLYLNYFFALVSSASVRTIHMGSVFSILGVSFILKSTCGMVRKVLNYGLL
jgi:hypothetical protein